MVDLVDLHEDQTIRELCSRNSEEVKSNASMRGLVWLGSESGDEGGGESRREVGGKEQLGGEGGGEGDMRMEVRG